jgi:hypothetical protein
MPPTIAPSLTPLLDRPRHDGLSPGAHGHLLMDNLYDLLSAAPPPLDRQHGIGKGTELGL